MKVMSEVDLRGWLEETGVSGIESNIEIYDIPNKVEIEKIKNFLAFYKNVDKKILFYRYEYEEKFSYYIDEIEEDLNEYDKVLHDSIRKKVEEHNERIESIDFEKPYSLIMFFIDNGFLFYHWQTEDYFIDTPLYDDGLIEKLAKQALDEMPEEEVDNFWNRKKEKSESLLTEMKKDILNNDEFKESTNSDLRKMFVRKYFEENPKYDQVMRRLDYSPSIYVESIWREYKASLKKSK